MRIIIEPTRIYGERGQRYRVHLVERAVLIEETWNPEFEACRALVAQGFTGRAEVWRVGATEAAMIIPDIAKAAGRTVVENEKEGPVMRRWHPFPGHLDLDAGSACTVPAPGGEISDPGETVPS